MYKNNDKYLTSRYNENIIALNKQYSNRTLMSLAQLDMLLLWVYCGSRFLYWNKIQTRVDTRLLGRFKRRLLVGRCAIVYSL